MSADLPSHIFLCLALLIWFLGSMLSVHNEEQAHGMQCDLMPVLLDQIQTRHVWCDMFCVLSARVTDR